MNILKIAIPKTYNRLNNKYSKKRRLGLYALSCLSIWVPALALIFSDPENIGNLLMPILIILITFYLFASSLIIFSKNAKNFVDDVINWPPYVHKTIIFWTLLSISYISIKFFI